MLAISTDDLVCVLTAPGVSPECGIPIFRGVQRLWRNYRIEEAGSPEAWHRDPRLVWEFHSVLRRIRAYRTCRADIALPRWNREKK
jgi:NAD-dependent deacetylase